MLWAKFGFETATLFFKSMQLAVHLNSSYLEKLEFVNQTPAFPLCILYEKIKKRTQYGHAILAHLLRQNTNLFYNNSIHYEHSGVKFTRF